MVEQWTENPCVPGSIPGGTTKILDNHMIIKDFLYNKHPKCIHIWGVLFAKE
jgi:hypothetical protein